MNLGNDSAEFDEQPFCSGHWEDTFRVFYKVVVFLYIVLTMTAVSGNSLILVALVKDSSLHPPSKLLLRSLTITDLCVGAFSQPLAITFLLSAANGNWNLCRVAEYSLAFSIAVFSDRYKCGQTTRSVFETQIQTSGDFKASSHGRCHVLAQKQRCRNSLR